MEETFDLAKEGLKPLTVLNQRQRLVIAGYIHTEGFVILQEFVRMSCVFSTRS